MGNHNGKPTSADYALRAFEYYAIADTYNDPGAKQTMLNIAASYEHMSGSAKVAEAGLNTIVRTNELIRLNELHLCGLEADKIAMESYSVGRVKKGT